jgi:hypothetical protein
MINFNIKIPPLDNDEFGPYETVLVDGIGHLSHAVKLRAQIRSLSSLDPNDQQQVKRTADAKTDASGNEDIAVILLIGHRRLGPELEQWAVEYTSKFVHAAGRKFYSTTMAQILGTAYVKKGLPEVRKAHPSLFRTDSSSQNSWQQCSAWLH